MASRTKFLTVPVRAIQTGIGPIEVQRPKARDRAASGAAESPRRPVCGGAIDHSPSVLAILDRARLTHMDQVRTPLDQTLALLDRAGRRRSRQYLNDRVPDREIKPFLVQVWPKFGPRGQDEECDQRQKAERAV
jgi:hypothetical protein